MEEIIKITDLRLKTKEVIDKILNHKITGIIVSRSEPQVIIQEINEYRRKEEEYNRQKEELLALKKKMFELECKESLKEIEEGKTSGPFYSAEELIAYVESQDYSEDD